MQKNIKFFFIISLLLSINSYVFSVFMLGNKFISPIVYQDKFGYYLDSNNNNQIVTLEIKNKKIGAVLKKTDVKASSINLSMENNLLATVDLNSQELDLYKINPSDGELTRIQNYPIKLENKPTSISFSKSGKFIAIGILHTNKYLIYQLDNDLGLKYVETLVSNVNPLLKFN